MRKHKVDILCTRELDSMLVYKATNKGIYIDEVSFVQTEPIVVPDVINKIKTLASLNTIVVFTSMNAVDAVTSQLSNVPEWNIYCVGGMTKETVFNYFGESHVAGTAKNAKSLAEKIILAGSIKKVYFFCSQQRLDELPETLAANGIEVEEIFVYKTTLIPNFIVKNYDGVLFFSPSAVHSFFSDNTIATNVVLFSIGNTTTATIKTYCTNKVITSEWPGKENMIDLVLDYYK